MSLPSLELKDISGCSVVVMGLGLNGGGLAVARFFASHGAAVTVTDTKDETALGESLNALKDLPIRFVLGRHEISDFESADIVIKNPAVRPESPFLMVARRVETDLSIFLRFCPSPIIAVTGSKGKSTTVSAITHMLSSSGKVFMGGNIAISPLSFINEAGKGTPVVLELSSWQLGDLKGRGILKPRIAVMTQIVPDHLDRYPSMEAYVADKRLIYADQDKTDYTICDRDDPYGISFASETPGSTSWYASSLPHGFSGAYLDGKAGLFLDGKTKELLIPERLLVPGAHTRRNMLAAGLACRLYGMPSDAIAKAAATFKGLEHRLEAFHLHEGIQFYNDSAATIPQAVASALNAFNQPIVLITGGTDKNLDFEAVRSAYKKPRRIVLLSGTGTDKLKAVLDADGIAYDGPFDNLEKAIQKMASFLASGDIVLFSPGATSFGMFKNEFDRGKQFKTSILEHYGA